MFGLGWMEISLLLLVLVLCVGIGPSSRMLGRLFGGYRKVNAAKQQLKGSFNPLNYLQPRQKDDPDDRPD
jgi:Sec-independent protein translocase protein TatA